MIREGMKSREMTQQMMKILWKGIYLRNFKMKVQLNSRRLIITFIHLLMMQIHLFTQAKISKSLSTNIKNTNKANNLTHNIAKTIITIIAGHIINFQIIATANHIKERNKHNKWITILH